MKGVGGAAPRDRGWQPRASPQGSRPTAARVGSGSYAALERRLEVALRVARRQ
jgi:hypothetical protein